MATLFETIQFFDNSGNPLSGGLLYWTAAGTQTAKQTWKDQGETQPHVLAYITLDGDGRAPGGAIFIRGSYDLVIKDSSGATIETIFKINDYDKYDFTGLIASVGDLNSTKTTSVTKNAVYTLQLSDRGKTILCDASSAGFTINLLSTATALNTYKITLKKIDVSSNIIAIYPNGSEKIEDSPFINLGDYGDSVTLHGDGSNWRIVDSFFRGQTILRITGSLVFRMDDNGRMLLCDTSSGAFNQTLPDCRVVGDGYTLTLKKIDNTANVIGLVPTGSQKIDDAISYFLHTYKQTVQLKSDGGNWRIVFESSATENEPTGAIIEGFFTSLPGWVLMNGGTIGNASSHATRANIDTHDLFVLLWTNVVDQWCPVYDSGSAKVPRGLTAEADYNASRQLAVPYGTCRSLIQAGTVDSVVYYLGGQYGKPTHVQAPGELAEHSHDVRDLGINWYNDVPPGGIGGHWNNEATRSTETFGSSDPFSILHPVLAINRFIKL